MRQSFLLRHAQRHGASGVEAEKAAAQNTAEGRNSPASRDHRGQPVALVVFVKSPVSYVVPEDFMHDLLECEGRLTVVAARGKCR